MEWALTFAEYSRVHEANAPNRPDGDNGFLQPGDSGIDELYALNREPGVACRVWHMADTPLRACLDSGGHSVSSPDGSTQALSLGHYLRPDLELYNEDGMASKLDLSSTWIQRAETMAKSVACIFKPSAYTAVVQAAQSDFGEMLRLYDQINTTAGLIWAVPGTELLAYCATALV